MKTPYKNSTYDRSYASQKVLIRDVRHKAESNSFNPCNRKRQTAESVLMVNIGAKELNKITRQVCKTYTVLCIPFKYFLLLVPELRLLFTRTYSVTLLRHVRVGNCYLDTQLH
jgi:hypothetical protein